MRMPCRANNGNPAAHGAADTIHDIVGIGFGPSNVALAIALTELAPDSRRLFLERQPSFGWHPGMLLEGTRMQISYLKDLVTMRDPTSPYTFLNYLKGAGRLEEFLNLNELHPSRVEYSRYLRWAAEQCAPHACYNAEVRTVRPARDGSVFAIGVHDRSGGPDRTVLARNVVVAPGGVARIPKAVSPERALHSSEFLPKFAQLMADGPGTGRVVLVGGGQSAGEIATYILTRYPGVELHMVISGYALRPTDNSPFVNEQFYSWRSRQFHDRESGRRALELAELRNSNYSVVEPDLLDALYRAAYNARLHGRPGLQVHNYSRFVSSHPERDGVLAVIEDHFDGTREEIACDALVLATGYHRDLDEWVFAEVLPHVVRNETGGLALSDACRVRTTPDITAGLYAQGLAEHSFGLGDTLLSLLPFRAEAIARDIQPESPAVAPAGLLGTSYPPRRHVEEDEEKVYAVLDRFRFATMVSARGTDDPVVSQLPLILDRTRGPKGVLYGHLDRANPHTELLDCRPVTLLFHGPNSYIAQHVYATDQLPTWNSITAVVRGQVRVLADQDDVVRGLCRIAKLAEPVAGHPTLPADDPRIPQLIDGVVGFEIEIEEMVGRFKLSQDRDDADRRLAARALAEAARADQGAFIEYLTGLALGTDAGGEPTDNRRDGSGVPVAALAEKSERG